MSTGLCYDRVCRRQAVFLNLKLGQEGEPRKLEMDRRLFILSYAAAPLLQTELSTFSVEEGVLVRALCSQVIPTDDAPGAAEAGVAFYIDRQLQGPLRRFLPAYRAGLASLRTTVRHRTGREFSALMFSEQTALLKVIEEGTDPHLSAFFELFVDHALQGFYGGPQHGGNLEEASWKMLNIVDVMEGHRHDADSR